MQKRGFTLIETVVAVGIFAILATIGSLLLFGTLRGAKKASAISLVRTEGVFALESMTSMLRFAQEVTSCTATSITFTSLSGDNIVYTCDNGRIASNSASLTSSRVNVDSCSISCSPTPPKTKTVDLSFTLSRTNATTILDRAIVPFSSQVVLRNY